MTVDINKIRLRRVIPQKRVMMIGASEFQKVNLQGRTIAGSETFSLELEAQTQADISQLMQGITALEIAEQTDMLNNPPNRMFVDGRPTDPREVKKPTTKNLRFMNEATRRIETTFGYMIDRLLFTTIERNLAITMRKRRPKTAADIPTGDAGAKPPEEYLRMWDQLSNVGSSWQWIWYPRAGKAAEVFNPRGREVHLPSGTRLWLVPKREAAGILNHFAARYLPRTTHVRRGANVGKRKTVADGFMQESIAKFKRSRVFKNYVIWVAYSKDKPTEADRTDPYWNVGRKYGSPYITVAIRRRQRAYRKGTQATYE